MSQAPRAAFAAAAILLAAAPALADDLYAPSNWSAMSSDRRATEAGDVLTVVIFQAAEASNSAQNASQRRTNLDASLTVSDEIAEDLDLGFGGSYNGRGEVRRSERLVGQISVTVQEVLPNGDFIVMGEQWLRVNGEATRIGVRGRVRPADIDGDNRLLSNRIADAQIDYAGRGFVSRSAEPGLLNRIFAFLGIG